MALKTKLDNQDQETVQIDIPLFATVEESVKDIKIDDQTEIKIKVQTKQDS